MKYNYIIIAMSVLLVVGVGVTLYFTVFNKPKNPPHNHPHPDPHNKQPFVFKISGGDCPYNDNYYQGKEEQKLDGLHTYYSQQGVFVIKPFEDGMGNIVFNICTIHEKCDTWERRAYIDVVDKKPKEGAIPEQNRETRCTLTYL